MKKIISGAVVVVLALLAAVVWVFWPPAPVTGIVSLGGLQGDVRVYRDRHAIPHIFANNLNDAYAALGFLHAENRLFQMEMMRRAGQGRLAEILGADLLPYDKKMRALGFARLAKANYSILSDPTKNALKAYAKGVNAYLDAHQQGLPKAWPPEFTLLGLTPEPWHPWQSLLWAKLMSWQLGGNVEDEIFRAGLLAQGWTQENINALYPPTDENVPLTTKPFAWVQGALVKNALVKNAWVEKKTATHNQKSEKQNYVEAKPKHASNAFVITGNKTKSGKPLLVNDPHLQLESPVLWYLARIVTPEFELKGATAAGLPFFPLGQNGHVAWGFTTNAIDVQDLVFVPEAMIDKKNEIENLQVKGGDAEKFALRSVQNYPVLSDVWPEISALVPAGHVGVLVTTAMQEDDKTAQALYEINQAKNVEDTKQALPHYIAPPQNFFAADANGSIYYAAVGAIPKRQAHDGFMPYSIADLTQWRHFVWQESWPFADNPQLQNPATHALMNGNNALVEKTDCPAAACMLGKVWADPYRAIRLEEILIEAKNMDAQNAFAVIMDDKGSAPRILKKLLPQLEQDSVKKYADVIAALQNWDGRMKANAPLPLIYNVWMQNLRVHLYGTAAQSPSFWPRWWALETQDYADNKGVLADSLAQSMAMLEARFGADWHKWRWGDLHGTPFPHPLFSRIPIIKDWVSLRIAVDGDTTTLQRAAPLHYEGDAAFENRHGAGYRAAYDLANPAASRFMIATGQSGNVLSTHFADLLQSWVKGDSLTVQGDEDSFAASGAQSLIFH